MNWKQHNRVIFHHIHKTAGTSLESVLGKWFVLRREYNLNFSVQANKLRDFQALSGHYGYNNHYLSKIHPNVLLNETFFVFTFLRNPLKRAISHYYHWQSLRYEGFETLTLDDFLMGNTSHDYIKAISTNWIARVLEVGPEDYKSKLQYYNFIGIQEEMDLSLEILGKILDKPSHKAPFKRRVERKMEKPTPRAIDSFNERNKLDYLIYSYGLERFNKDISQWE